MSLKEKAKDKNLFTATELNELDKITWTYNPIKYPEHAKRLIAKKKDGWTQSSVNPNVWSKNL